MEKKKKKEKKKKEKEDKIAIFRGNPVFQGYI